MNTRRHPSPRLATACALLLLGHSLQAATYYWDNNGTISGFGTAAGTWTAPTTGDSSQGWSTSATGTLAPGNITTATADFLNFGTGTSSLGLATGTITVSGTVSAANITFGSASGPITLSGGTIAMGGTTGTFTANNPANTINSAITGTNGLIKAGTGTLNLTGTNTYTGATRLNGGILSLDGNTGSLAATSTITGNGGTFVYDNTNSTGAKTQSLGAVTASSGATTISNIQGGASSSTLTVASQAARTVGATLNYVNSGAGASIVTTTGASFDRGVFLNGSNYAVETSGSAIAAPTYVAYVSGSGFFSTSLSGGTITVGTNSHWLIDQNVTLAGGNSGNSTYKFSGSYTLTNTSTLTLGGVLVSGGQATISGNGSFRIGTGGGDIVIRTDLSSDSLSINQNVVTTNNTTPTIITKSGAGTLTFTGSANSYGGSTYVNEGTLRVTQNRGLGFGGNNTANIAVGSTTVAAAAKLILSGATTALTVNEPIILNGGSLENDSTTNAVTIDNGIAGLQLTNAGLGGTATTGTVTIGGTGSGATATVTMVTSPSATGAISGLQLTSAGTGYTGTPTVTFTINGQTTPSAATAILSSVTLNGSANTIGGAGNLIINAVVADGTSSGGFAKIGAGTVTLNGANTYTGATTVNAGTLSIGAADRIANTSNLVMAGGTFATGGFSETLGTLTLTASSTIDLGSGASALVFSDSSGTAWGSSITLSFVNFTEGVDSIRIGTTSDGLTGGQLAQITLNGLAATINSSGFLVSAIPEPSAYAVLAGAAILGFAALRRRRVLA